MTDDTETKSRHVSSLNAKLLAHGYAKRPLKLDRLSDSEQVHVANVITELLGSSVVRTSSHLGPPDARQTSLKSRSSTVA
jgi:hypothetical protein